MNDLEKWKLRANQLASQLGKPMQVIRFPHGEYQIAADTDKHQVNPDLGYRKCYSTREDWQDD